ncbi:hypothetical protein [Chitinophaga sp. LS1]|uniref:hypothetical protein n=1 Tax=Chitinophaga sp. LS1 TaxID=3051176 RepID=UPI002AAB28DD|nr:hypothetical protein [Chitinophaga sp. LS1]WPV70283.1 hypothetical protein QQL36_16370 [Chitinophaga sp. LS1]
MQLKRTLPLLTMALLLFCSFTPAPAIQHIKPLGICDFAFENNTVYTVADGIFYTSKDKLVYSNVVPGTGSGSTIIEFDDAGDTFTYYITFATTPTTPTVVHVYFDVNIITEVIPAGVTSFRTTIPGPLPYSGIVVTLDPK